MIKNQELIHFYLFFPYIWNTTQFPETPSLEY